NVAGCRARLQATLVPPLRAGLHDRPDGEGPRAGRQRRARAARTGGSGAGGPAGAPPGVVARVRAEGLLVDLYVSESIKPRITGLICWPGRERLRRPSWRRTSC